MPALELTSSAPTALMRGGSNAVASTRSWNARRWRLAAGLALVAGFLPLLCANFARYNDYVLWMCERSTGIAEFPEMWHLFALGRPLGAILLNLHFTLTRSLDDLLISRWVAMGATLLAAWLLAEHLERRTRLPSPMAACAAACVFLLPASQLYVSWVTNFVPGTLTVLLALVAYRMLDSGRDALAARPPAWHAEPGSPQFFPTKTTLHRVEWRRFVCGEAIFLFALLIYPPAALFILVPCFANLVFSHVDDWPKTRRRLARDLAFTATGMLMFFAFVRFVYLPGIARSWPVVADAIEANRGGPYDLALELKLSRWHRNAWDIVLVACAGPWHALLGNVAGIRLGKLIWGCLLVVGAWRLWRLWPSRDDAASRARFSRACFVGLAGTAVFLIAEAPAIVAQSDGIAGYRVVFPAEAMVALLIFAMLPTAALPAERARTTRVTLSVALLMTCGALAYFNTSHVVQNAILELNFFRRELAAVDLQKTHRLEVVCPVKRGVFVDKPLRMDLRLAAVDDDVAIPGIVAAVLEERGLGGRSLQVSAVHPGSGENPVPQSPDTLALDLNRLIVPGR
jgi:hypothetical protein